MFQKAISKIKLEDIFSLIQRIGDKVYRAKIKAYDNYISFFQDKNGLEIAGLSSIFAQGDI